MADALCGPSNALQSFQKHTSVDRTLQQDRLTSRASSSQGFRSGPGPNAGILDPEFEAFQAGIPSAPLQPDFQHFSPQYSHTPAGPGFAPHPATSGWASDFQRLHISSPPPAFTQRPAQAASPHQASAAWHQDFLRSQNGAATFQGRQTPIQPLYGGVQGYGLQNNFPMYGGGIAEQPVLSIAQGKQRQHEVAEHFDEAAFERAFDAARAEMLEEETLAGQEAQADRFNHEEMETLRHATNHLAAQDNSETARQLKEASIAQYRAELDNLRPMPPEHFEQLSHEAQQEQQHEQEQAKSRNDDELAATAGQLLESVSSNTSKKFQESQFLQLMRRLRDREVRVEGDKMVEVSPTHSPPSHSVLSSAPTPAPLSTAPVTAPPMAEQTDSRSRHLHMPPEPEFISCKVFGCNNAAPVFKAGWGGGHNDDDDDDYGLHLCG
ncbi:hypothetical protein W97_00669 [Coniosporium apollinis CBS 100218]|uniref:Peroxin 20 n=1 Tax=Coniosporium apollinis (strain CBS 100218) TaxID=1168221 RepID=R7YI17_CONA1|nr:uncharacterized protein W97_00669 [Coniosporium apollinis CBS 100218]EON61454.1 hypothetical protein W97_00669 [Coniosporium apollinis CBS 100218]